MNTGNRTDEELNKVIAEWCGWTFIPKQDHWQTPDNAEHGQCSPPNYCRDLNAVHEAERKLADPFIRRYYFQALDSVTGDQWNTIVATARQRAEALVRVIETTTTTNN